MVDPAEIARGLTKAQREWVLRLNPVDIKELPAGIAAAFTRLRLIRGLGPFRVTLTDRGLRVRQHIKEAHDAA